MSSEVMLEDPLLSDVPQLEGFKVLGGVALYEKLGQGGMGAVFKGRHVRLDVDVAVKVMSPPAGVSSRNADAFIKRFIREARVSARISHPNIVRTIDVNSEHGLFYLCMDFVDGESAADRLRRKGTLEESEALEICLGAAEGLAEAHSQGIVHRDIKPDNVMIDKRGRVYLADLGLAKAFDEGEENTDGVSMTGTQVAMGTPSYMPPEQFISARTAGPAADVWALGITLYQLLTGELPWRHSSLFVLGQQITADPLPDPRTHRPELSAGLVAIIEKCCQKEAADRYPTGNELAEALRQQRAAFHSQPTILHDKNAGTQKQPTLQVSPPPEPSLAAIADQLDAGAGGTLDDVSAEKIGTGPTLKMSAGDSSVQSGTQAAAPSGSRWPLVALAVLVLLAGGIAASIYLWPERRPAAGPAGSGGDQSEMPEKVAGRPVKEPADAPDPVDAMVRAAQALKDAGSLEQARDKLTEALGVNPDHAPARALLVEVNRALQEQSDALERTKLYRRWMEDALSLKLAGKLSEAAEAYDHAVNYAPDGDNEASEAAAQCRHDFFVAQARKAMPDDLNRAYDLYGKALEQVHSDETESEQMDVLALLRKRQLASRGKAAVARAEAAMKQRKWSEAAAHYEEAAEHGADVAELLAEARRRAAAHRHLLRGQEHARAERWSEAMDAFRQGRDMVPDDPDILAAMAEVRPRLIKVYTEWPFDAAEAARRQRETSERLALPVNPVVTLPDGIELKLALIPAGEFVMGNDRDKEAAPAHRVRLTRPFYMGVTEVTQAQCPKLLGVNPSQHRGDNLPAEQIWWKVASGAGDKQTGFAYRLPTEAEWEYACLAGSEGPFFHGTTRGRLTLYGWYAGNSDGKTHPVGAKQPNAWGLYDMHGNVAEMCSDWFGPYPGEPSMVLLDTRAAPPETLVDPKGPATGRARVVRGGAYALPRDWCDGRLRMTCKPSEAKDTLGFRIVIDIDQLP